MQLNEYTAIGEKGMIAFASSLPGTIIPYELTPNKGIIVQKRGFLAMEKGLDLSIYFQKRLGKVYLQSMPIINVAGAISAYITPPSSDSGIKINLGEN